MGVKGLLPLLKPISKEITLSDLRGSSVAVDTYCWLHKAALCCSDKIALSEDTELYLNYCLKYLNLLLSHNIKVILVFDGKNLPAKKEVEEKRRENRDVNMKMAVQLLLDKKTTEAKSYFDRCVNISHDIALKFIKKAYTLGVKCIVAPYEADAQLAFLGKNNFVDFIITDDSDLLLFGTPKVLFKLDFNGKATLIEKNNLNKVFGFPLERYSFDKFRHICIISGCDYFSGVNKIGLITAIKLIKQTQLCQLSEFLQKINMYSRSKIIITKEEIKQAVMAEETLLHQIVFDPLRRKQVPLTDYPIGRNAEDFIFAGQAVEDEQFVFELACGKRNPRTREIVSDFNLDIKLQKDSRAFHYGLIRNNNNNEKLIDGRKSTDFSCNRSKSMSVKCEFPWKNASKLNDSDFDITKLIVSYTSSDITPQSPSSNSSSNSNTHYNNDNDNVLTMLLDKEESVVNTDVAISQNININPFSKLSLIRNKRTLDEIIDKENNNENKKSKILETEGCLTSKKIIAKSKLSHLFMK